MAAVAAAATSVRQSVGPPARPGALLLFLSAFSFGATEVDDEVPRVDGRSLMLSIENPMTIAWILGLWDNPRYA